ncbi:dual specificity protein phosphatase 22-B [Girardinichthys multiradiatus]|uniref:dual specificity protein phosphatase 22-B n=1 Tax=Girardinichthys multiradiatus TaxID=208333 RepID=UPI001FAC3152|nr:dual specificity protein phosphatase 22-B [Girardinichthys multiradiatus]
MVNGINKVLPDLYLGTFNDTKDTDQLAKSNIKYILSIHEEAPPRITGMTHLHLSVPDTSTYKITQHFKQSIMFMHESRLEGAGCLVHCLGGKSRSVTLVVAYIMTVMGLGWKDALDAVKVVRPGANPNLGFQTQLQTFEDTQVEGFREWFRNEYEDNPFNDEADTPKLLARESQ